MDEWKVTYTIADCQPLSVKVKSNNEFCAREKAKMKLSQQYGHLIKDKKILHVNCKRLTNYKLGLHC